MFAPIVAMPLEYIKPGVLVALKFGFISELKVDVYLH